MAENITWNAIGLEKWVKQCLILWVWKQMFENRVENFKKFPLFLYFNYQLSLNFHRFVVLFTC